jgi:hypothetical protein
VSFDIYVPIRGTATPTPNMFTNLGVNFGPQAPPTFSLPAPQPWSPPSSALYGRAPDTVVGSLTPPHGQGPLTGAAPAAPRTAAAGPASPVQPAQQSSSWYWLPTAYSTTVTPDLNLPAPGPLASQIPGGYAPPAGSQAVVSLAPGTSPIDLQVQAALAGRPRTDSHGYLTPGARGPATASPSGVQTTDLQKRTIPGPIAAGTIGQGYSWGAQPQGGYPPGCPPQ